MYQGNAKYIATLIIIGRFLAKHELVRKYGVDAGGIKYINLILAQ